MAGTAALDEQRVRAGLEHVDAALRDALAHLGLLHDQAEPLQQRMFLQEIRWSTAEAQRVLRHFRLDLDRRLAGTTPDRSLNASPHAPPEDASQEREAPPP